MTFVQRPQGSEGGGYTGKWGKSLSERGASAKALRQERGCRFEKKPGAASVLAQVKEGEWWSPAQTAVAATHGDILGTRVCSLAGMSSRWLLTHDLT